MFDFQSTDNFSKPRMRTWWSVFSHRYSTIIKAARLWGWSITGLRYPKGQISLITASRRNLALTSPSTQSVMRNFPSISQRMGHETKKLTFTQYKRLRRILFNWLDNCSYLSARAFWSKMITTILHIINSFQVSRNVFHTILTINDYFPIQHQPVRICTRNGAFPVREKMNIISWNLGFRGPCNGSGAYVQTSSRGGQGSIPRQYMWDMW